MDDDSREAAISEMQRRALPTVSGVIESDEWGGGYRGDVESVSMDSFKEEIRRGVNG